MSTVHENADKVAEHDRRQRVLERSVVISKAADSASQAGNTPTTDQPTESSQSNPTWTACCPEVLMPERAIRAILRLERRWVR